MRQRYRVLGPELRLYGAYAVIAVQRPDGTYVGGLKCPHPALTHTVEPEVARVLRKGAAQMIRRARAVEWE